VTPRLSSAGNSMLSDRGHLATHLLPLAYGADTIRPAAKGQRRLPVAVDFVVLAAVWGRWSLVCRRSIRRWRVQ
jgi:hypothetical protein